MPSPVASTETQAASGNSRAPFARSDNNHAAKQMKIDPDRRLGGETCSQKLKSENPVFRSGCPYSKDTPWRQQFMQQEMNNSSSEAIISHNEAVSGMRMAVLELSRLTEQVAILSSFAMGGRKNSDGPKLNEGSVRNVICKTFLRCLNNSLIPGAKLFGIDLPWKGWSRPKGRVEIGSSGCAKAKTIWAEFPEPHYFGRVRGRSSESPDYCLDLVASPIDGVVDLLDGKHGGSVSVIAGGLREATFCLPCGPPNPQKKTFSTYFVLATGDKRIAQQIPSQINIGTRATKIQQVSELQEFFKWLSEDGKELMHGVATMHFSNRSGSVAKEFGYQDLLASAFRRRDFVGSPVAAAMTVLHGRHGFDLFSGAVRETNVLLISAAARALGGHCFAIRLEPDEQGKAFMCPPNAPVFHDTEFVKSKDVFLVATGVTAHPFLKGVRFYPGDAASTHTIVLNGRSQTMRIIDHRRQLRHDLFQSLEAKNELLPALEVILQFRKAIRR